jgi:hypothetical protein
VKLDCTRAYDGQGAFRNGLHDAIRLPSERRLYRSGHPWAWLKHALWSLGNWLGRFGLARLLVVALLGACSSQQRAETAHAAEVFRCEVSVLAPYVPEMLDAEKMVEGIVTGQVSLPVALGRLGVQKATAERAIDDFNTCFAGAQELQPLPPELQPEPVPEGETSRLVAPPPGWGNKVL